MDDLQSLEGSRLPIEIQNSTAASLTAIPLQSGEFDVDISEEAYMGHSNCVIDSATEWR